MSKTELTSNWRNYVVFLALVLAASAVVLRLADLQISQHSHYQALAKGQQSSRDVDSGNRGEIYAQDRHGNFQLLATNSSSHYVFATPPEIEDIEGTIVRLNEILDVLPDDAADRMDRDDTLHSVLVRGITPEQADIIEQKDIPGIYVGEKVQRFYPQGSLAAHVLGFVNNDGDGQYGIEEHYDDILRGKEGLTTSMRNPAGYLTSLFADTTEDGSDIVLSLDYNIQAVVESVLEESVERLGADNGTVIIMEPSTGKLIAFANTPTFDPNRYSDSSSNLSVFQNHAIQRVFEPGSTFKALTLAAAMDDDAVTPETSYMDEGEIQIGGRTVNNYDQRVWDRRSMTEVLMYSINTGVVFAERRLGHGPFVDYLERFGVFERTKVDLAGEVYSKNQEFKNGYEINYATASFGQGIETNALQMVRSYSVFARDGTMVRPYVAQRMVSAQGVSEPVEREKDIVRVVSPKTAAQVTGMLTQTTEEGFAKSARVPGYFVAGKTGTAQMPWSSLGISRSGYSDKTIQSFVGYAPAFEPRFVMLVSMQDPAARTAEYSVVPVFQEIAQYMLNYYEIPPDRKDMDEFEEENRDDVEEEVL